MTNKAALTRARAASRDKINSRLPGNPRTPSTPGTNPALRSAMPSHPMAAGPIRRTTCAPMTAAQRNSEGRMSEWAMSPEFFTDPKWGRTLTDGINP